MRRVLGYEVSPHDNGSFFYAGPGSAPACPQCGLVTDERWVDPGYAGPTRHRDLGSTYDGATIATDRFLDFIGPDAGLDAIALPAAAGHSLVVASRHLPFDAERAETRFHDPCDGCGRATQIAGGHLDGLVATGPVPPGFHRSDQVFGSAAVPGGRAVAQFPIWVVDVDLAQRLADSDLVGFHLEPYEAPEG